MNETNTIPAVEKAVALLEFLGSSENEPSQAELAKQLEITPSSCYRILQTLTNADWVRKTGTGRFQISGGILAAAGKLVEESARFELLQPLLAKLSRRTGLSCKLSIRRGGEQITILRGESPRQISVSGKIGAHFPLIEGSVGAALLADADEAMLADAVHRCREEIPERTRPELLAERLTAIRTTGYALNDRPNRWKVQTMSTPVRDEKGTVIAALTLIGWAEDFAGDQAERMAAELLKIRDLSTQVLS